MNILHVSPVVYLDRLFFSYDLAGTQAKKGHNVAIIGANSAKSVKAIVVNDKLRVYLLPSINFPYRSKVSSSSYVLGLQNFIENIEPDILHIQTHLNLTVINAVRSARKLHVPAVTTIHGVTAKINPLIDAAQLAYLRTFGGIIFENSHKIICLTKQDCFEVMQLGCSPDKIVVVPNGVDTELFKPNGVPDGTLIAWHGRFVAQKGLEHLIKAAALVVRGGHPEVKFALVGDGPLKRKMMLMVEELGLTKNILFIGRLPSLKSIELFLNKATVYVLPSLREGMPWALLEAMACGKPVVGSDISGINDVITNGQNGFLVPPMDPEALANAILQLLNDEKLRRRLSQNARQLMAEKYSWDIISKRIEKVYSEAMESVR
jgi:glycosyltransferase involved in cell wall biosynthesis